MTTEIDVKAADRCNSADNCEGDDCCDKRDKRKCCGWGCCCCVFISIIVLLLIATAIVLPIVLTGDDDDDHVQWSSLPCNSEREHLPECPWSSNPVLLVSLDGFRAEYLLRGFTPTMEKFRRCGAHTPYLRSVYPTFTFPNHYTIVTGLYPESHGIVRNSMYDPDLDKFFSLSSRQKLNPQWYKGEPIWSTVTQQGKTSAAYFWPGSDVNISGIYPDYWLPYDGSVPFEERVHVVLEWLSRHEHRPDQISLYFEQPGETGNDRGPDSSKVDEELGRMDAVIAHIMDGLMEKHIDHCVNVILVADHGMAAQDCSQTVFTSNYTTEVADRLMWQGTAGNIYPEYSYVNRTAQYDNASNADDIVDDLSCVHPTMKAFNKATFPRRHHYGYSERIGDVILDMKEEWNVFKNSLGSCSGGNHGWDETYNSMHAIFLAHGPAFKENFLAEPFDSIEVYNMMCELLDVTPAHNNGTDGSLQHILVAPKPVPPSKAIPYSFCRVNSTNTPCDCDMATPLPPEIMMRSEYDDIFPLGEPKLVVPDKVCIFNRSQFNQAYSQELQSPIWMTTILTEPDDTNDWMKKSACSQEDSGFIDLFCGGLEEDDDNDGEDKEGLTMTSLIGKNFPFATEDAQQQTMVPLFNGFRNGRSKTITMLINDYIVKYGNLSVTMGPLFDYNNDGRYEGKINETSYFDNGNNIPIPTHMYVIIAKCMNRTDPLPCENSDVDVLSFILPNVAEDQNCLSDEMYLIDNLARIRDIELMGGFEFMTVIGNRRRAIRLRTFLPHELWPTDLFPEWIDLPCPESDSCTTDYRPLVIVSLDGFRADYLLRNFTPTIARLAECGAHAEFMRSVYPTKFFPNHNSIVTGLYPESHGIVASNMYDVNLKQRFSPGNDASQNPEWWKGEPLWVTAQNQGLKAATFFWPGATVNISGTYSYIARKYDRKVTYESRIQEMISWMLRPADERPDLFTLYIEEVQQAGKQYGPDDIENVGAALEVVDRYMNDLMEGLYRFGLHNCVDLVVLSSHGMAEVDCDNVVSLRDIDGIDYNELSTEFTVWEGTFGRISNTYVYNASNPRQLIPATNPEPIDDLVSTLTCASDKMDVYTKPTLPVRFHYSNNDRIDNILLDMDVGWLVARDEIRRSSCSGGGNGYDNREKSMESLFLAYGPSFKSNYAVEPFENIELYNMFTDILNITAAPNNGTGGSLSHMLQNPEPFPRSRRSNTYKDARDMYDIYGDFADLETKYCNGSCVGNQLTMFYRNARRTDSASDVHIPLGIPKITSDVYVSKDLTILYEDEQVSAYFLTNGCMWVSKTFFDTTSLPEVTNFISIKSTGILNQRAFSRRVVSTIARDILRKVDANGETNVVIGYAFDDNHDSLPDDIGLNSSAIASHLVVTVTSCLDCSQLQVYSYILPRQDHDPRCQTVEEYLDENLARVRDVEIITGFEYYMTVSITEAVRLRTYIGQRV